MKRETIERHLREIRDNYRQLPIGVRREKERLEEELADLDAKEASFVDQSGNGNHMKEFAGFTDCDGYFWEFVETSQGWVVICFDAQVMYTETEFGREADALRAWLKETGRR